MTGRSTFAFLIALAISFSSVANATIVSDDIFDDGDSTANSTGVGMTTYTQHNGNANTPPIMEAGGMVMLDPGADNWIRVELQDNTEYAFPSLAGESVTYCWTVGMVDITTDRAPNGQTEWDHRIQLNVNDATIPQQASGAERWVVAGAGNLSLDLLFNATDANGAPIFRAQVFEKNLASTAGNDGAYITDMHLDLPLSTWDFTTTTAEFCLTMDSAGYEWSSSLGGSVVRAWADGGYTTEFQTGSYGVISGQHFDWGRATSKLDQYTVDQVLVPEPGAMAMVFCGLISLLGMRFRR